MASGARTVTPIGSPSVSAVGPIVEESHHSTPNAASTQPSNAPVAPGPQVSWKPDETVQHCERCSKPFNFFRRRHHCRRCGGIFCASCANEKTAGIAGWSGAERVCKTCSSIPTALRLHTHPRERRVVMLGAQGVGKSTLHNVFVNRPEQGLPLGTTVWETLPPVQAPSTVSGSQCAGRRYHHKTRVEYHLYLLDTLGQPQYGLFQAALAVGTHAFLLVFSAYERSSLNALRGVREKILDCGCLSQPCIVVCTTRGEQAVRSTVSSEEGRAAADEMHAKYFEVNLGSEVESNRLFEYVLDEIVSSEYLA